MKKILFDTEDCEVHNCCDDPQVIETEGNKICQNCGLIHGKSYVSQEERAYTQEEVKNRRRTEPRWRSFGPRTVISGTSQDHKGYTLVPRKAALYNRLSKIQGSLINSIERNYWESKPKLTNLAKKLNLPEYVTETAWKIYSEVAKLKLTMGRSIDGFVTASIYAAIRIHEFPRVLEEVVEVSLVPIRAIHKSLALILRRVLKTLNLSYKPITPKPLIFRFGNELGLSVRIQNDAVNLLKEARKHGLVTTGKDPKGFAAALLFLTAKNTDESKTQSQISQVARITEVTLRTRAKQIKQYINV